MAKHIHIYLHRAPARARTADAGNFDESKHKRDDDGKFSSTGGGGGGGKKEPQTAAGKREAARRAAFRAEADKNAQAGVAKFDLASLKHVLQRPHQQLTVGRYGSTTPERGSKPTRGAQNLGGFGGGKAPEKSGAELASPSPQGSWSATAHNATIAAAEDASNEAWSSGSHKKAIAAFEKAIASTQQAIKVGSPKYAGERQQQLKRLQERLNHHKQAAR